ncbi:MAG: sigma-70 family RNA polymerase sigma factor [Ilumatobacter sp.]|uniref:RNA polymerase sigma factor n=1 Tax=Ilumatobacter sp. TaxID=1967498 RepID=UPI00329867F0
MEDETERVDHAAELLRVYDEASDEVFRYVHARCGNRSVAEDVTAETFLAAVGQVNRDQVDRVTVAWLIGIARHKLIDHWRRAERRPRTTVLHETSVHQDALETMNGEDPWDQLLDRRGVCAVMQELGAHHRSALVLRYFDGLSVPEVADHLGRTVHATETLLVRARRAFRRLYERDEAGAS